MFTRRHYEKIAEALNWVKPSRVSYKSKKEFYIRKEQWDNVVLELSDMFSKDNGNFDRGRFGRACQGNKPVVIT